MTGFSGFSATARPRASWTTVSGPEPNRRYKARTRLVNSNVLGDLDVSAQGRDVISASSALGRAMAAAPQPATPRQEYRPGVRAVAAGLTAFIHQFHQVGACGKT
jgi:hypothetical protein